MAAHIGEYHCVTFCLIYWSLNSYGYRKYVVRSIFDIGKLVLVLLVVVFVPRGTADSLQRVATVRDQERLKQLLLADANWNDLHTSYLAIKGLESLGTAIPREVGTY